MYPDPNRMAISFSPDELNWLHGLGYTHPVYFMRGERSTVGLFLTETGDDRVIKRAPVGLEYEYEIGRRLYQRSQELEPYLRIVGQTLDLLERNGKKYLVLERLPGKTLGEVIRTQETKLEPVFMQRYITMLRTLHRFEVETGFTHYDLHHNNIITDDDLESFKIIDFGRSHYPGVTGFIEVDTGSLFHGKIASVMDPWLDLVRLVLMALKIRSRTRTDPVPKPIAAVLLANGFSSWVKGKIPAWASHHSYKGCGIALVKGIGPMLQKSSSLWKASQGGFWVNDGTAPPDPSNTPTSKVLFGIEMAQIKQKSVDSRPNPDPTVLLDLFDRFVSTPIDEEETTITA